MNDLLLEGEGVLDNSEFLITVNFTLQCAQHMARSDVGVANLTAAISHRDQGAP